MKQTTESSAIKLLEAVAEHAGARILTIKDLIVIFGTHGHYAFILFLTLPFLQPVPLLGLSVVFGGIISTVALFAHTKRMPHVPQRWQHKAIPQETTLKIIDLAKKIFQKLNCILKRRFVFLFHEPFRTISTGLFIFHSILLALPLPIPFSNFVPAVAILLLALAHLENDGLFVILAYLQTALSLAFFIVLAKGAWVSFEKIFSHF
jgi:hypothetical protein